MRLKHPARVTLALVSMTAAVAPAGSAASATPPRVKATFVGDSVAASLNYSATAQRRLRRGLHVRLDLKVCRRLVRPSCPYRGVPPRTALQAVRRYGRTLGHVLVVDVGYNDDPVGYGKGVDRVLRAAKAAGVTGVVWVTLKQTKPMYRATNAAIRAAAKRWPQITVADWNAHSRGRRWFRDDGVHLTPAGATAFATWLRPIVVEAATSSPPPARRAPFTRNVRFW